MVFVINIKTKPILLNFQILKSMTKNKPFYHESKSGFFGQKCRNSAFLKKFIFNYKKFKYLIL